MKNKIFVVYTTEVVERGYPIEAKSEEEARELLLSGEFDSKDIQEEPIELAIDCVREVKR